MSSYFIVSLILVVVVFNLEVQNKFYLLKALNFSSPSQRNKFSAERMQYSVSSRDVVLAVRIHKRIHLPSVKNEFSVCTMTITDGEHIRQRKASAKYNIHLPSDRISYVRNTQF